MKIKELLVPLAIVAMIVGMVLPLPSVLLDILLIINLLLATALLLSALSVNDPIKLSALPTILLLATLYRLTLNISTTRLILSGGDAGQVVAAFGSVVIGGSIAVGLVVFLIITLIQFIVIAKGAERIAEVAARFTLDALPGKQMSVDADVRSGLMDVERARDKREELQVESRFYGALDGAMKFVKGDAIAGLIIVVVNIIGGVCVGLLVEHLSITHAFQKFVTLTIGDGLVSQIPALLNSLTAGIIVTKVARSEDSSIVNELFAQIGQGKMVRGIICFVSLMLGLLPGMPSVPFVIIGLSLLIFRGKRQEVQVPNVVVPKFQPRIPPLIAIAASASQIEVLKMADSFAYQLDQFRQTCFEDYGYLLPRIELIVATEPSDRISLLMRGATVLKLENAESIDQTSTLILSALRQLVAENRAELMDDMHTRRILDFFETIAPDLVSSIVPGVATVTQLTVLLRSLARDGVSIKNFDVIMQAIAEAGTRIANDRQLLEEVRVSLGRIITERYVTSERKIAVITVDPLVDLAFLEAERGQKIIDADTVARLVSFLESVEGSYPIIVSKGSRAMLSDCLVARGFLCQVIAFEELPRGVVIMPVNSFELTSDEVDQAICGEERLYE